MSDEKVGGLPDPAAILYPDSGFRRDDHAKALWRTHGYDTGGEPFYSADQLHSHAAARVHAALSAHGQPVVDVEETREVFEKWLMKRHGFGIERWADSGEYRYHNTKEFWECWKLALTGATP